MAATDEEFSTFTVFPLSEYPDHWSEKNKLFKIILENHGVKTDKAYLEKLFEGIFNGEAQRDNPFQTPADVLWYNLHRIWGVITKGGKK